MRFEAFLAQFNDVPGFTIPESLGVWDCLLRFQLQAEVVGPLLEIGVYYGKSAALLAGHSSAVEDLFLVDPSEPAESACKLLRSIKPEGVHLVKNESEDRAVWNLVGTHSRAFRWIHIDGDHKGKTVYNDLLLANELLSPSGIICVDDFMNPRYPQLTYTVCTFVELFHSQLQMFLCGFNKAYLVRPSSLFPHLTFVKDQLGRELGDLGFNNFTIYKTDYPGAINCFGMHSRWDEYVYFGLDENPQRIVI
jgi:predicted O-methyltransferase YrrM